ncbi:hydantoinase/oxoprolinase family protein [[Clostridium] fimetarium]|uniref:N-methylhydantoinase A/oxoprolinase/acetone carboxylase, beta subunit n=1 Tax=[Clostridium] fimetarium TaxID=99656 RepID=A0A1I0NS66_9FIRM|nr:hydantoinase/oxoprolinase family protein [[Clostridium] fimetarium]SEW04115.1 N-methylhydantoinase A/oxoprolinase/acetone carboxylase, beta subunit [[Clostridium] fimetarium]
MDRKMVRMGIDVGGTHTKAVAIDNATHQIIGKSSVKTTHNDKTGVAAGVVAAFQNCLKENDIAPEDVIFVAHSTTQATNALIEGDVATVGVIGMGFKGIESILSRPQSRLRNIDLGSGKKIIIKNKYIKSQDIDRKTVRRVVEELQKQGAEVIVASEAFGVDDIAGEQFVYDVAHNEMGLETTIASDITKLYGLKRRTRTAAINASILPKMLNTANSTEEGVRKAGVSVPLMIMRGDGGVMEINEMKKRPVLTMLSGPAASVMGSLMYLRASNGVYFEVGGTTTNIGVIKNGRPAIDYSIVGGHRTYISSLDVQVLGVAGGSMIRVNKNGVHDVGPRSAHIAGLDYAVYTDEAEIVNPQLEFFSPKEGDPDDYVAIKLASGKRITITNSCAANVLGLVEPTDFSYGNINSAKKAMQPIADYIGVTVEEVATQILSRSYEKIKPVIMGLAEKYKLEHDQISLVGVGGGAKALIGFCSDKMNIKYSVPENAEVISSIGVALAMVRDVVERVVPNPTSEDIKRIKIEAINMAVESGAEPGSVEVHIEIDSQTSKLTAIAIGSTEVKTTDLLKECSQAEAKALASEDLRAKLEDVKLVGQTNNFYVFSIENKSKNPLRILDKKGFIKVQRTDGNVRITKATSYRSIVTGMWEELSIFKADAILRPDYYICVGARVMDFNGSIDLEQILMLMDIEMQMVDGNEDVIIVGAKNQL